MQGDDEELARLTIPVVPDLVDCNNHY